MGKVSEYAQKLRLPKATVTKALKHPASVPFATRKQILNYAYRHGEEWILKKCPTQLLVITKKRGSAYAQEVYGTLAQRYFDQSVRLVRYEDPDRAWSEISSLCATAPSGIVVLGETPKMLIDYLSTLPNHVLYVMGSSVPARQKLSIGYFEGTAALTAKLNKKAFKTYFAYNNQKSEATNEKLLGFLSTLHTLEHSEIKKRLIKADEDMPSPRELPSNAAIVTPNAAVAHQVKTAFPDLVVACIELTLSVPNTMEILYATALPNELAADIVNTLTALYSGESIRKSSVKITPRFL